jgi:Na+/proline symporter
MFYSWFNTAAMVWTDHYTALSTALVILIILLAVYVKSSDPYGLFHLSLNKLPGENPHTDPKTEWLNMGYWKVSCARLRFEDELIVWH